MAKKKLANALSWSFSRYNTFTECQKRYWYTYYGSWEGWPKTPFDDRNEIDSLAQYLYMLKQMQTIPTLTGSCVHEVIEEELKSKMPPNTREKPEAAALVHRGKQRFLDCIAEVKSEAWRISPKKYSNLFEYYYRTPGSDPFSVDVIDAALQKIERCLTNWISSPIGAMIYDPRADWVSVEEFTTFSLNTCSLIVIVDFIMRWKVAGQPMTILFDWKTGQEADKTIDQLYSYAIYAHRVLHVPYDAIILSPFYLAQNSYTKIGAKQQEPLELARVEALERTIVAGCAAMKEKLPIEAPVGIEQQPDPKSFTYTSDRRLCARCSFRELCNKCEYCDLDRKELAAVMKPASV